MTERPILFSGPMVLAILAGRKTQTRRAIDPRRYIEYDHEDDGHMDQSDPRPGDQLWVRETWRTAASLDKDTPNEIAEKCLEAGYRHPWAPILYVADGERSNWSDDEWGEPGRIRSGRFMPLWASRIALAVTGVRVERAQDITETDAVAEGVTPDPELDVAPGVSDGFEHRLAFARLWDSLNGRRNGGMFAWQANPWVWVLSFRRVQ